MELKIDYIIIQFKRNVGTVTETLLKMFRYIERV